jgi:hypothetical protein
MSGAPYGYCPHCGSPGIARERRIGGYDRCEKGHDYPSLMAVLPPEDQTRVRPVKPHGAQLNPILNEINDERRSQIAKGYDAKHDDEAAEGQLYEVAAIVLLGLQGVAGALLGTRTAAQYILNKWRHSRRKQLLIAAALLVAEIERLDRIEARRV